MKPKIFGDEFVGLKYENEKLSVYFPLGYSKSESDKEKLKDILNLISVLDAKYYKYGVTKEFFHLPNSSSIVKQIAYAEYIAEMEKDGKLAESENIYNAFIMPGNVTENNGIENIGYATGDWTKSKSPTAPYYKIQGIVLDVKSVMQKHAHSTKAIMEMAECIEKGF